MKKYALLALVALSMTSCWVAQIYTEVPAHKPVSPTPAAKPVTQVQTVYTTQVTTPSPKVTTVTTFTVTNYSTDPCFYLDLNAVAAAFAESRSVREFEELLNSRRYMINNLDLNRDGWVDYLRVIETHRGYYHTMLIQACLAPGMFQDVATLVAERQPNALYVEVIGDRYLYGYNYIVRPVFVKRPPMWDVFGHPTYAAWSSPYYYGSFPSYYTQPQPVYLSHYQAYVTTYMNNCPYCHHCDYPQQPHYSGYVDMTQSHRRNDYQNAHPDNSFERRVTSSASSAGVSVRNAGQLRTEVEKSSTRTSGKATTATTSTASAKTSTPSKTSSSSTPSTPSASSSSSSTRTSGTAAKPASSGTAASSAKPASSASTSTRQPSTTVNTRVGKNGTTRTTVKTTDDTGRTTTVKRESGSSKRTSGAAQTSGSSTRSSQGTKSEASPHSSRRAH